VTRHAYLVALALAAAFVACSGKPADPPGSASSTAPAADSPSDGTPSEGVVDATLIKSKQRQSIARMTMIRNAMMMYRLEKNRYPALLADLVTPGGDYLNGSSVPVDAWGNAFAYALPDGDGGDYTLLCLGADGAAGGEGADRDFDVTHEPGSK
jgi:hypothetical protein